MYYLDDIYYCTHRSLMDVWLAIVTSKQMAALN